jgi:hypothetical protein
MQCIYLAVCNDKGDGFFTMFYNNLLLLIMNDTLIKMRLEVYQYVLLFYKKYLNTLSLQWLCLQALTNKGAFKANAAKK